jgi:hypothetical protein
VRHGRLEGCRLRWKRVHSTTRGAGLHSAGCLGIGLGRLRDVGHVGRLEAGHGGEA